MEHSPSASAVDQLWKEALEAEEAGQDPVSREVVSIITTYWDERAEGTDAAMQESLSHYVNSQMAAFRGYRDSGRFSSSPKGPTEKMLGDVRQGLKSVAEGFQNISEIAGQAASIGFPPAGLVVAVVARVIGACLAVSSDFDLIEQLFKIIASFMQRLDLLRSGMPKDERFRVMVSYILYRIVTFCTNIRKSVTERRHRRLTEFAKALYRGQDPNLRAAYDNVVESINDLDKAAVMETLAIAVRIDEGRDDTNVKLEVLIKTFDKTARDQSLRQNDESRRQHERHQEVRQHGIRTIGMLQQILHALGPNTASAATASAQTIAFRSLTQSLWSGAEECVARRLAELLQLRVKGTFEWLEARPEYQQLCNATPCVLTITGDAGTGKSTLAAVLFQRLNVYFANLKSNSVAYFCFDGANEKLQNVANMLSCCAAQVAQQDPNYGEAIKDESSSKGDADADKYWDELFASKFSNDGERKLLLVIDGVDQLDKAQRTSLARYTQATSSKPLAISFVLTGGPGVSEEMHSDSAEDETLDNTEWVSRHIQLGKEELRHDFRLVAAAHLESFNNLSRLQPQAKKAITSRIQSKADNFLYIDHALRKLAAARIPRLVSGALGALPNNTSDFYEDLLKSCEETYSSGEQDVLAYLLAWMAYCHEGVAPLTLSAAQLLLNHAKSFTDSKGDIRIQDQVSGRLARILAISDRDAGDFAYSELSPGIDNLAEGELNESQPSLDTTIGLTFLEPSLRNFFQVDRVFANPSGLRPPRLKAHVMMVELTTAILLESLDTNPETSSEQLRASAARHWASQFLAGAQLAKDQEDQPSLESLFENFDKIMREDSAIRLLESVVDVYNADPFCSVLGPTPHSVGQCRDVVEGERGGQSFNTLLKDLSACHIRNWSSADSADSAYRSLRFAYCSLYEAGVPNIVDLGDYRESLLDTDLFTAVPICVLGHELEASHQGQVSKALFYVGENIPAMEAAEKGKEMAEDPKPVFELAYLIARPAFEEWQNCQRGTRTRTLVHVLKKFETAAARVCEGLDDDVSLKSLNKMFQMKARLEAEHDDNHVWSRAIESMEAAVRAKPDGFYVRFFAKMVKALGQHEAWDDICKLLDILKNPLSDFSSTTTHRLIHRATRACGKEEKVRDLYKLAVANPDPDGNTIFETRVAWAAFERFVMSDRDKEAIQMAKERLWENLESMLCDDAAVDSSANALADICLAEYLNASDLKAKKSAQSRLEDVMRVIVQRGNSLSQGRLSPIAASLAIMRRRLGSAETFRDEATGILRACVVALSDDLVGNDSRGLRQAARILALVPGCVEDAKVALACRYFDITPRKAVTATETSSSGLICDLCRVETTEEEGLDFYTCVYCTDIDLCPTCFETRDKRYNTAGAGTEDDMTQPGIIVAEQPDPSYVEVCPWGHPYLKNRPSNLEEVREMADDESLFQRWLGSLESKWLKAWENYVCDLDFKADAHLWET